MKKFPPLPIGCTVLIVLLVLAIIPVAAQQTIKGTNNSTGQGYEWNPFEEAALYFSDFEEVQRLGQWIFTTGTPVGGKSTALVNGTSQTLSVVDVPSPNYCVLRCSPKTEVFVYFHAAGDKRTYEAAVRNTTGTMATWSAQCSVIVIGKTSTNGTLFTYTKTLSINQERPEQLFISDITVYFPRACSDPGILDHILVTVATCTTSGVTAVDNALRLEAGYKEELNIDSRVIGENCSTSAGWTIIEKGYTYVGSSTFQVGSAHITTSTISTLTFEWQSAPTACVNDSFPNYQFQLLRLYNTDAANLDSHIVRCTVDWSRALTLETGSKKQELQLTIPEGRGFYIWRVRVIGNYYEGGITNPRNWGCWSRHYADGSEVEFEYDEGMNKVLSEAVAPVFYYQQFDKNRNWGYSRTFNETGTDGLHINEGITYTDALLNPMQTQMKLHAEGVVIGAQTVYDHAGRPSLQTLPAPIAESSVFQQDIGFKAKLLQNASAGLYTADDFVGAVTSATVATAADGPIEDYYSSSNSDLRIPTADGYPFASTSYYRDGRVREQGGVGIHHRVGATDHHTGRVFYASVTDKELVSVFGDEAPAASSVHKTITQDPNGVATVQYMSKEGLLLAVCLTDAGELPDELNEDNTIPTGDEGLHLKNLVGDVSEFGETVNVIGVEDEISGGQLLNATTFRAAKTYTFMKPTTVTLTYELTTDFFQESCMDYCGTCDYEVDVRIVNTVTGEVVYSSLQSTTPTLTLRSTSGTLLGCSSSALTPINAQSVLVDAGTYVIERIIRTNIKNIIADEESRSWHVRNALNKVRPLDDILKELHLIENGSTAASLDAYTAYRNTNSGVYSPLTTGATVCGQITLPEGACPTGCPEEITTGSFKFPEFESYMFAELEPGRTIPTTATLNEWFKNAEGGNKYEEPFPNHSTYNIPGYTTATFFAGRRLFDELVWNMIREVDENNEYIYPCENLWRAWVAAVAFYKASRGSGGGVPQVNGKTLDLLELFLTYALTTGGQTRTSHIQGRRPEPYGTSATLSEGYLSHAHRYFKYTSGASKLCETTATLQSTNATTFKTQLLDPDGPDNGADWRVLYECLQYTQTSADLEKHGGCVPPEFPIISGDIEETNRRKLLWTRYVECIKAKFKDAQGNCEEECEDRRGEFEKAIVAAYGSTPVQPDELQCMVDALVENCKKGCELQATPDMPIGFPESPADIQFLLPTAEQYESVRKRLVGTFTVRRSTTGTCPAADPDVYEYAEGNSKSKKSLLAQYLTDYYEQVRSTCASACAVNFYEKAVEFLGTTACIGIEADWVGLTNVVIYPDSKGSFTLYDKVGKYDQCCELAFRMERRVRPIEYAESVEKLNNLLDDLWGMEVPYTPVTPTVVATNLYLADTAVLAHPVLEHAYYRPDSTDPWQDTLIRYANELQHPILNTANDGTAVFKVLSGDQDYSGELSGVLASTVTDVFSTSGTWRAFGTIVLQMPRETIDDPVQKVVVRLTRSEAVTTNLIEISLETKIGKDEESETVLWPVTVTAEEFIDFTSKSFTESIGSFTTTATGKIDFTLKNGRHFTTEAPYRVVTTTSLRFVTTCSICELSDCGICIAWHEPVTTTTVVVDADPIDFAPLTCEEQEIERLKDLITEEYIDFVNSVTEEITALYEGTCMDASKVEDLLTVEYEDRYYHYTLFYYDRAGNLVRMVQPKGVNLVNANTRTRNDHPAHTFKTQNAYNSSGQGLSNTTPDGGESQMWYDGIGRPRFTQDAVQEAEDRYNYINYDRLGRVVETGEMETTTNVVSLVENNEIAGDRFITELLYDTPESLPAPYSAEVQRNTLHRLSAIRYAEVSGLQPIEKQVSYFSYDEHGNQEWEVSQQPQVAGVGTYLAAKIEYDYNLVSGTLTQLSYQEGYADRFYHRYSYDINDRLKYVETSRDGVLWEKDASYEYYLHGPLKRAVIGEDSVQGTDYVYTINGWLKGINHPSLAKINDPGGDGNSIGSGKTRFAADVFGMMFEYFPDDFDRTSSPFRSTTANTSYMSILANKPLYDGTIRGWSTNITPPVQSTGKQLEGVSAYAFQYDVLYRLRSGDFATYYSGSWHADGDYEERHEYDANGNHVFLSRWGRTASPLTIAAQKKLDEFDQYTYTSGTNRLRHFTESGAIAPAYPDDIDGNTLPTDNYQYDLMGRIVRDCAEGVETTWDSYNRVVQVVNYNYSSAVDCSTAFTPTDKSRKVVYHYDGGGRRTIREEYAYNVTGSEFESAPLKVTRYVYGAMGLLGVYEQTETETTDLENIRLIEWPVYGMGRLGTALPPTLITYSTTATVTDDGTYNRPVSKKLFEITDHLGNVTAVVSDLKLVDGASFRPDVRSYTNYYPYGLPQPNRYWSAENYRFGYNGVEKENTTYDNGTTGSGEGKMLAMDFRMYDARLGRWWGQDPIVHPWESPYVGMGNNPVNYNDPLGLDFLGIGEFLFGSESTLSDPLGPGESASRGLLGGIGDLFAVGRGGGGGGENATIANTNSASVPGSDLSSFFGLSDFNSRSILAPFGSNAATPGLIFGGAKDINISYENSTDKASDTDKIIGYLVDKGRLHNLVEEHQRLAKEDISKGLRGLGRFWFVIPALILQGDTRTDNPPAIPAPPPTKDETVYLYRTMHADPNFPNLPLRGDDQPSILGVRTKESYGEILGDVWKNQGWLYGGSGGMSTYLSPWLIHYAHRPVGYIDEKGRDGISPLPLWRINIFSLPLGLVGVWGSKGHVTINALWPMPYEVYVEKLHQSALYWQKVIQPPLKP